MIERIRQLANEAHKSRSPLPASVRVHDFQEAQNYFAQMTELRVGDPDKPAMIMNLRVIEDKSVPVGTFRIYDDWGKLLAEHPIEE